MAEFMSIRAMQNTSVMLPWRSMTTEVWDGKSLHRKLCIINGNLTAQCYVNKILHFSPRCQWAPSFMTTKPHPDLVVNDFVTQHNIKQLNRPANWRDFNSDLFGMNKEEEFTELIHLRLWTSCNKYSNIAPTFPSMSSSGVLRACINIMKHVSMPMEDIRDTKSSVKYFLETCELGFITPEGSYVIKVMDNIW